MPKQTKLSIPKAIRLAKDLGWDFKQDFHAQNTSEGSRALAAIAKLVGYRKPRNGSGSTARYFFAYLKRKIRK